MAWQDLRGMYGQTFQGCAVWNDDQEVSFIVECGRVYAEISGPVIQSLLISCGPDIFGLVASIQQQALDMERAHLEAFHRGRKERQRTVRQVSTAGHVYILRGENGRFKIGRATNLDSRLKSIATSSPILVQLAHSFKSTDPVLAERYLHEKFTKVRHHREWFDLAPGDIEWLRGLNDFDLDGEGAS